MRLHHGAQRLPFYPELRKLFRLAFRTTALRRRFKHVAASDFSPTVIDRMLAQEASGVEWLVADALALPASFTGAYDVVFAKTLIDCLRARRRSGTSRSNAPGAYWTFQKYLGWFEHVYDACKLFLERRGRVRHCFRDKTLFSHVSNG